MVSGVKWGCVVKVVVLFVKIVKLVKYVDGVGNSWGGMGKCFEWLC